MNRVMDHPEVPLEIKKLALTYREGISAERKKISE